MHLGNIGAREMASRCAGGVETSSMRQWLFRRWRMVTLFRVVLLVMALPLLATGCRTFSTRVLLDPTPAVERLQAGGGIGPEVDCLARPLVESGEIKGIAVGVLASDGRTSCFGYGCTRTVDDPQLPEGDTLFQVGSVSKLFLTALLAVLVEEGALHYEDTVRSILPPEVPLNEEIGKVTLYELATNTGGLPRQPSSLSQLWNFTSFLFTGRNLYAYFDKPYLYHYLRNKNIKPREARDYVYSNIGFGLLAHLIVVKTGRPYHELLEEKICRPLNLRDTTFEPTEDQKKRLAIGHVGGQPRFMRRGHPMAPWDMGEILGPPGCLYSTANDLLIFAKANLGMLGHPLEPVLASTQRVQLSRPTEDVALGWLINYFGEDRSKIIYKQGVMSGYASYIGMDPRTRTAVVVLYNTFTWDEKIGHNLVLRLSHGLAPGPILSPGGS